MISYGSLFAGIGGLDLGLDRAGMSCRWQVERDEFCLKVLAKHWPNAERFTDVKEVGKRNLKPVDLVCGGFPCQPHSYAGSRKASADERDLWGEFARIIGEIRPTWIVAENVPGLLTSESGKFFGRVLRGLAELGYDAEWYNFPASAVGAPHGRNRVFIVAYPKGYRGENESKGTILEIGEPGKKARVGFGGSFVRRVEYPLSEVAWNLSTWGDSGKGLGIAPTVRMDDGISQGLDKRINSQNIQRRKALGNAVVPQVAELIGRAIVNEIASKE